VKAALLKATAAGGGGGGGGGEGEGEAGSCAWGGADDRALRALDRFLAAAAQPGSPLAAALGRTGGCEYRAYFPQSASSVLVPPQLLAPPPHATSYVASPGAAALPLPQATTGMFTAPAVPAAAALPLPPTDVEILADLLRGGALDAAQFERMFRVLHDAQQASAC
jgi:hypothetical protein